MQKNYTKMYKFKLNLYKVNGFICWLIRIWICGHYLTKQNALIIIIENLENIYNFYLYRNMFYWLIAFRVIKKIKKTLISGN